MFAVKARTALALGLPNLARVLSYRAGLKAGLHPVLRIRAKPPGGPFFLPAESTDRQAAPGTDWRHHLHYFGYHQELLAGGAPDWHYEPFNKTRFPYPDRDWWTIPDFNPGAGDIKAIWELSRFDWVLGFAQQMKLGYPEALDQLNDWLDDWCRNNPPYRGPNWKCGQEAAIRVMHLAMAALLTRQTHAASPALRQLVHIHLQRIAPTLSYAIGQDNNHGTSEAAALFIGGSWLKLSGSPHAARLERLGRKWLENRAKRLIARDGTFSQYSVNYHRVALDTFSMVEIWRRHLSLPPFSPALRSKLQAATRWLVYMTDERSGDACNIGANDGARLLPLTATDYRDFKPSTQLASILFLGKRVWSEPGSWDLPAQWLDLDIPAETCCDDASRVFPDGGFAVLRKNDVKAVLRFPRFRFRPSQADILHLDLWVRGRNVLRDGGTYSYAAEKNWLAYFSGVRSHNTVQFDHAEPMPRLNRFLFGDWVKTSLTEQFHETPDEVTFSTAYKNRRGVSHRRAIRLRPSHVRVEDEVSGFGQAAVLRWRLAPGDWSIVDGRAVTRDASLSINASVPITRMEIVEGWESRYYMEKTSLPVLEIEIRQPGTLVTEYRWES